ncbi:copper chaperone PCu(A)C [Paenarthrobacter nitroguajacolicus]|uniref:copper chaperone PCu(A)C n=1 Tax=Paenarthrobacter nitroguajacolicus TaxID=211146 RepID=UPI001FCCADB5|nr:copper chaperone PCu(A)C [Paenarthrobacter nitroguajacolicus]
MTKRKIVPVLSLLAAASFALSGCGQSDAQTSTTQSASPSQSSEPLTVSDTWIKTADSGMSAAFGSIRNTSDKDVTIVSAAAPVATMVELHETVMGSDGTMKMQAKQGGFVVPARGELKLEPGANHIMLMDLTKPVQAGDEVTFELKTSDGGTVTFTAQAKDFSGANENYTAGEGSGSATPAPSK